MNIQKNGSAPPITQGSANYVYNMSLLWKTMRWKSVDFQFSCKIKIHPNTFPDLTTWKCVISIYTFIYVKLRYIAAQEKPFQEFHIPHYRKVLWQTHLFTFSTLVTCPYLFSSKQLQLCKLYLNKSHSLQF